MTATILESRIPFYYAELVQEEKSPATIQKYLSDIRMFLRFLGDNSADKDTLIAYKKYLYASYKPSSADSYIVSINRYLRWMGFGDLCIKLYKRQKTFSLNNVLNIQEYRRLLAEALRQKDYRMYYLMKVLGSTGIRVGELQYVTAEALEKGVFYVECKNKIRDVYIPRELSEEMTLYCRQAGISMGVIFRGKNNQTPLGHTTIWRRIKTLAESAGVDPAKAYPHSFRHLFAQTYMESYKNLFDLADLLGHSSLETTRIYARSSAVEKRRRVDRLGM